MFRRVDRGFASVKTVIALTEISSKKVIALSIFCQKRFVAIQNS